MRWWLYASVICIASCAGGLWRPPVDPPREPQPDAVALAECAEALTQSEELRALEMYQHIMDLKEYRALLRNCEDFCPPQATSR